MVVSSFSEKCLFFSEKLVTLDQWCAPSLGNGNGNEKSNGNGVTEDLLTEHTTALNVIALLKYLEKYQRTRKRIVIKEEISVESFCS